MKKMIGRSFFNSAAPRRAWALALSCAMLAGALPVASAQMRASSAKSQRLTEDQRAAHVLNRLGFGARPGDVERVRRMGVEKYVEQQLQPAQIDDAAAEARLRNLEVLKLSSGELLARYPQPNFLLRRMQREDKLPSDLAELRDNRKTPDAASNNTSAKQPDAMTGATANPQPNAMPGAMPGAMPDANPPAIDLNRAEYRQAVADFYRENGLQLPQRVTAQLQASRILRAVYSERQLQESLVDFWTNHFNIYAPKGADRWLLVSYDRDVIRPRTLGKFRDLLVATAQSPAMLFYLDNFQSVAPNPNAGGVRRDQMPQRGQQAQTLPQRAPAPPATARPRRGINENYARELMELHTLGVDGGYTQKDVQEVARCFTGWTIIDPRGYGRLSGAMKAENSGTFYFNPRQHDDGEKNVLGHKIPAGGGISDGLAVLDILSKHPSTAKFVATKLARKFVMDEPTPELVSRVAAAFTKSDGDIRETLRALFSSPEFNAPANYRAKIKTPFELAVSAVRALGGETNAAPALHQWIARMGEPLYQYQAPTGYPDTAEHWVNTGALLERINFALALVSNRIPGTRVDLSRFSGAAQEGGAPDKSRAIDAFAGAILQGDISPATKASLLKQLDAAATNPSAASMSAPAPNADAGGAMMAANAAADAMDAPGVGGGRRAGQRAQVAANNAPVSDAARIAALILGSPEFQRQ
ncbi:MAG: DUF1800 domain-containing protein [Acidobacteria bacterium]|nr:DUF1800 domain-containing protein [Acidobacteriota bacterium]